MISNQHGLDWNGSSSLGNDFGDEEETLSITYDTEGVSHASAISPEKI